MSKPSLSFAQVKAGDTLPPLTREISLVKMMMYGAATWDFIRIHYDADYVRARGLPHPFVDGQMLGAYLAQLVMDWAGPEAFLTKLSFRNRVMVFPSDTVTCLGRVTGKGDGGEVELELWIDNQQGERVVEGSATVVLPQQG